MVEALFLAFDGTPRVDEVFEVFSFGRPLAPSRPYTQSRFRSWQAPHIGSPEQRIFLDLQKWQLFRIDGAELVPGQGNSSRAACLLSKLDVIFDAIYDLGCLAR